MVIPCARCVCLGKSCIKSEGSSQCAECIKAGGRKCIESEPLFSESEWRRLVQAQQRISEEREATLAKLLRLDKQERLLRKRAGDFIARDFKEIEDLERLEEDEQRQKELESKAQDQHASGSYPSLSEDPLLPSLSDSQVNEILNFSFALPGVGIPESSRDSSGS